MKNLKITEDQHKRIKAGAEVSGLNVSTFTNALVEYALDKLDSGEIKLLPAHVIEGASKGEGVLA